MPTTPGAPRIGIGPGRAAFAEEAVRAGGGIPLNFDEPADALVWLSAHDVESLEEVLDDQPGLRWVQMPFAGVEQAMDAGIVDTKRLWTCAKGSYADVVAEHALALAL